MNEDRRIRKIVIVGGGTAGWIAASLLARTATEHQCAVTLIESTDIGTVGVGEATIPPIIDLLRILGIDEADFIRHTQATFKLGIQFKDWRVIGERYWHPFGTFGTSINRRPFHHFFLKARRAGQHPRISDYAICAALGDAEKFYFPDGEGRAPPGQRHALHFDAALVARYLRAYASRLGVEWLDRKVAHATLRADGFIDTLICTDGTRLQADLYVDCSGFRGVLIEEVLATGYIDWSAMLPCDRAVAMQTRTAIAPPPFTVASARGAGWQWRIPLQHRAGNGYVYSSAHVRDDEALEDLIAEVREPALTEPRYLRFTPGRRKQFWNKNCVALGLAAGFLEPIESTNIQLVINAVLNLLDHFPDRSFEPRNIAAYNQELVAEIEAVRDFIVLHYCRTERADSALWRHCREMPIPDSLQERIGLYEGTGRIRPQARELFTDLSWFYVLDGMGVKPATSDPLIDGPLFAQAQGTLTALRGQVARDVQRAPAHLGYFAPDSVLAAKEW
ncbi:MAG TPA: tryptophan halogenase family protein [Steroidobacteraceae bacterium]|nr:tryptophan halogenase family protein [Steroidobacteraceae bacterium]